jgi:hypothetical protein
MYALQRPFAIAHVSGKHIELGGQALKASHDFVQLSRLVGGNIGFLREVLIFFGERLIFFGERLALRGGKHLQSPLLGLLLIGSP